LQAQLNASLATFSRTVDDYGKLAKQEPVQTKQEKAFERLKNFRSELDEYRESFKRIKSANEEVVRSSRHVLARILVDMGCRKPQKHAQSCSVAARITPRRLKTHTPNRTSTPHIRPSPPLSRAIPTPHTRQIRILLASPKAATMIERGTFFARMHSSVKHRTSSTSFLTEVVPSWAIWATSGRC
jgi:hypothetical protein